MEQPLTYLSDLEMLIIGWYLISLPLGIISLLLCTVKFKKRFPFFDLVVRNKWWLTGNILYFLGWGFCFLVMINDMLMTSGPGREDTIEDIEIRELHDNGTWTQEAEDSIRAKWDTLSTYPSDDF